MKLSLLDLPEAALENIVKHLEHVKDIFILQQTCSYLRAEVSRFIQTPNSPCMKKYKKLQQRQFNQWQDEVRIHMKSKINEFLKYTHSGGNSVKQALAIFMAEEGHRISVDGDDAQHTWLCDSGETYDYWVPCIHYNFQGRNQTITYSIDLYSSYVELHLSGQGYLGMLHYEGNIGSDISQPLSIDDEVIDFDHTFTDVSIGYTVAGEPGWVPFDSSIWDLNKHHMTRERLTFLIDEMELLESFLPHIKRLHNKKILVATLNSLDTK